MWFINKGNNYDWPWIDEGTFDKKDWVLPALCLVVIRVSKDLYQRLWFQVRQPT